MGNVGLGETASPSIFVKTKTKKFYFMKMRKRKSVNFVSSAMQDKGEFTLVRATECTERQSPSNTCITHEEQYCKMDTENFFKRFLAMENISVVVTSSTFLHGSDYKSQHLPLGIILNALFRYDDWLYVRTAHGQEGYIAGCMCLPLEAPLISPPAYECDTELEPLESLYKWNFSNSIDYNERNVDMLYLQANGIRRRKKKCHLETETGNKSIKLVIKCDFAGIVENTISVKKGDVVFLQHNRVVGWFWVKNEAGREGLIPAAITGYITNESRERRTSNYCIGTYLL